MGSFLKMGTFYAPQKSMATFFCRNPKRDPNLDIDPYGDTEP